MAMSLIYPRKRKWTDMASSSSSSPLSVPPLWCRDVFISFRGEDTRYNFTSHLLAALTRHGYNIFHDTQLKRGEHIDSGLSKSIEESRISIVVFSERYADSRWCLDELVKIMDCRKDLQQIVVPVFYHVDPSHVRKQEGCYANAFLKHEECFPNSRVVRWREALSEAANLAGFTLNKDQKDRDEAQFIARIVEDVASKLNQPNLHVADYPVGIESRVQNILSLLNSGTKDVSIVAIWGLGGIGKTTIAKATYNKIYAQFESSCFLLDVRETIAQSNGLVNLQKKLISDVLGVREPNLDNSDRGIEVIRQRLWRRRVLIVLDDVDNAEQLKKLAIYRSWLCQGSRILITTRDRSCLSLLDADAVYEPIALNKSESLSLFNWYAFGKDHPKEGYEKLAQEIVEYSAGLPLVLEIWGPYMRCFKKIEHWQAALRRLKIHSNVQEKLKLSFDSLDDRQKDLFLDIACFFVGMEKDFAIKVLEDESIGCFPEIEIEVLVSRCLVKINTRGDILMHDIVRDMGKEIVRLTFKESKKHTRLWGHEDAFYALEEPWGTETVESIFIDLPKSHERQVDTKAFAMMRKLRLLYCSNLHLHGVYICKLSLQRLKWFWWYAFPLESLPSNIDMGNLVALHLQKSRLKQLWKGTKDLNKLRFLDVSCSRFLTRTPTFSGLKNLERLVLGGCISLVEVLDLSNCRSLTKIPLGIVFRLKSLEDLDLFGCSKLEELVSGPKVSLSILWRAFSSALARQSLPRIQKSRFLLPSNIRCLRRLSLKNCNLVHLPSEIGNLASLQSLDLGGNKFLHLPESIVNLHHLEYIRLRKCDKLKSISILPGHLIGVEASNCMSLETLQIATRHGKGPHISVENCPRLMDNLFRNTSKSLQLHQGQVAIPNITFSLDEDIIPHWFNYQGFGSYISFVVPPHIRKRIQGFVLCVVVFGRGDCVIGNVYNKSKDLHNAFFELLMVHGIHIRYVELSKHGIVMEKEDEVEIMFTGLDDLKVLRCGLRLIYDKGGDDELLIQYSPDADLDFLQHDGHLEYVSPMMMGMTKSMLDDGRGMDGKVLFGLVKELVEGHGKNSSQKEHSQVYHILANALYTDYVHPHGGLSSPFLKILESSLD